MRARLLSRARARRLTTGGLVVVAGAVFLSWALLAALHVGDRYRINHVSGAWMALAFYANAGILYPPLYDGQAYGGTRFMPLPILVHAALARLSGEYLRSGKLLGYAATLLLLGMLLLTLLRRARCAAGSALGLTALVLASYPGVLAGTSIRNDALPVALQLGALYVIGGRRRAWAVGGAAALCTLAFLSKLSALWAPAALALWLGRRSRRELAAFLLLFGGLTVLALGGLHRATEGRMVASFLETAVERPRPPWALVAGTLRDAPGAWALLPLVLWRWTRRAAWTVFDLGLLACGVVLVGVFTDPGAASNHLLDLVVLAVVAAGQDGPQGPRTRARPWALLLPPLVLWGLSWSFVGHLGRDLARTVRDGRTRVEFAPWPLGSYVAPSHRLLSEDPYVPVTLGQRPVVLDPFMFARLGRAHPDWAAALARRIEEREFHVIVTLTAIEARPAYYQEIHFGPVVAEAIRRHYVVSGEAGGYVLYTPRPRGGPLA